MTKQIRTLVMSAAILGTIAYRQGRARVPGADAELNDLIKGLSFKETVPVLKAWMNSWDAANLAACATSSVSN